LHLGTRMLRIASVYMVAGLVLGLVMGITGNFALTSTHTHGLLLGWVTMALTGLAYLLMPGCGRGRLAGIHFWGHNLGLPVMLAGLAFEVYGAPWAAKAIAVGSIVVLLSLVSFCVNLFLHGQPDRRLETEGKP